ncbi:serine/threonine-protein kinase [Streptomyces sp. NPDC002896]|uniref:serine/threonine-protein kinase n=1 Tax=Streptomyces sp. NPDC002896 TaxID=3154438 RepID=UPI00332AD93A
MRIAGRYELHDPIGRGAMGEVWRAFDESLGRPVAVKLLLPQDADPTAASRFRLEAQTAGRLNHPHLVGVFDFGEYEDRLFLVMELVGGDSLARHLASTGPMPAGQVARIAAQAAAGLAAAHQQGIVHRDIKPANLLLDADGTVKIGDFGIARFLDDPAAALTTTGQIVGTSLYLAPERALGQPADPACDVYSLGCVLYQLLTGRPPFRSDTAVAILHQHLDASPVPPRQLGAELPPAFQNYLLGLLAKLPEDRPTAQQVADWFASGAWQGRPEPLPAAAPAADQQATFPPAPGPGQPPGRSRTIRTPAPRPRICCRPPPGTRHGHTVPRRRGLLAIRELTAHRPGAASAVAASVIFLAAMLVGMLLSAPEGSSAENPQTDSPGRTSPATASEPSTSPTPPTGLLPTSTADRAATESAGSERQESEKEQQKKQEQTQERHDKDANEDEDD